MYGIFFSAPSLLKCSFLTTFTKAYHGGISQACSRNQVFIKKCLLHT